MQPTNPQTLTFILVVTLVIALLVTLFIALLYFYSQRQRRHQQQMATIEANYAHNLLTARLEIKDETMRHIGREIHDTISLNLSLANMQLTSLARQLPAAQAPLASAATLITQAIEGLHHLSHSLDATAVEASGLETALQQELAKTALAGQYQTHFSVSGEGVFLEDAREVLLFRVVQEALHNIVKHAHARTISLHLAYAPRQLTITLADDGVGLAPGARPGMGLKNMQHRAASTGGTCTAAPGPQGGTVVTVVVPLRPRPVPDNEEPMVADEVAG
jgi:two-component system, NarL family, sensor kinase